jgi:hypothetical protein
MEPPWKVWSPVSGPPTMRLEMAWVYSWPITLMS